MKKTLKTLATILGIITAIAGIAAAVYYFFKKRSCCCCCGNCDECDCDCDCDCDCECDEDYECACIEDDNAEEIESDI